MLVHHADSGAHRLAWSAESDRNVVKQNLAAVGLIQPKQHVHHCGLACTVLTEQRVNTPRLKDDADGVVRYE